MKMVKVLLRTLSTLMVMKMSDFLNVLEFMLKCAAVVAVVKCVVTFLKNKDSHYSSRDFSYDDVMAINHFRLCRDIAILCGKYDKTHSEELEKEIIHKFHDMLTIDREDCFGIRCSAHFSTDMYCTAIQRMTETGLVKKYEEVYNERSEEESTEET